MSLTCEPQTPPEGKKQILKEPVNYQSDVCQQEQSQVIANAFYFCSQLSGGMSAAVLLFIVNPNPKNAKVLLGISCLSFRAFNLFGLGYNARLSRG
jgi:hypothetical protein